MGRFRQMMIAGAGLGFIATTIANLKEGLAEPAEGQGGLVTWLISLVILAAVTAIVWLIALRLRGRGGEPATAALVFAILALIALLAFWSGISGPLAGATGALVVRDATGRRSPMETAALVVAGIAVVLMLIASIFG